jgi:3-hydroxyisobutyrate dehydrogenase-like beta-hydroxyacid dehydrogenase
VNPLDQPPSALSIGLVGHGEVGRIFVAALLPQVASVGAWDLKYSDAAVRSQAQDQGIHVASSLADLCQRSQLVISAVTASSTLAVAQEAAGHLRTGAFFLDMNSASPGTKQQAAAVIDAAGGRFVEAGVMTSVPPHGIRVPMLIGGPHALALLPLLNALGMRATVASERLGVASATKMCRSVMIKGLEALVIESFTTARAHGVEDAMIATLQETFPGIDWTQQGSYFFSRVAQHGKRRAEEMREAANTVREAGFEPSMASAIAEKHEGMAAQARAGVFQDLPAQPDWHHFADALLKARGEG